MFCREYLFLRNAVANKDILLIFYDEHDRQKIRR